MSLVLVTAPSAEPVSLTDTKLHLRVDSTAEDDLIAGLITSARDYCETYTQRAIPLSTWDLKLPEFPCDGVIWLPLPPCVSVTSITYIDTNGATQTLSAALYTTDLPSGPKAREGCIVPAYQQVWPQTRHVPNAVIVRFVAGYTGTTPEMVKLCIKEHVRANYGRGSEDRVETMAWIAQNLWGFRSF